jgi:uncharacterized protein YndB with AHSA1/START domain
MAAKNKKPNELYLTRTYDAPVKAVWDAWTDPEQVAKWWGPRGFTLTTHSKDLKVGGHWDYTMHGPDGKDWPNLTKYHEVEKYSRLVYDHGGSRTSPPLFRVTVNFIEHNGKTTLDFTMAFSDEAAAKETAKFIKQASGDSTWDRLAEFLDKKQSGKDSFVIQRTFHSSLNNMFKMWTDPKHFTKWLPPAGFSMEFIKADIKPGSESFYSMSNGAGLTMYGKIQYIEIKSPDRIVYTQQFADADGNLARHPMAPTWPATMLTTVSLVAEDDEHTRVKIEWQPHGDVTKDELETFIAARAGMTGGWTGSFDKLEDYLEKQ